MALTPLPFKPGINNEVSQLAAGQQWWDGNRVRFYRGQPTPIGGWQEIIQTSPYWGTARRVISYTSLSGKRLLNFGTNQRLYAHEGGINHNITPIRDQGSLTDPFTTTSGNSTVSVSDTGHGVSQGDVVNFSNATSADGIDFNGDFLVTSVTDGDNYIIETNQTATGSTAGTGGTVDYIYEINSGSEDQTLSGGFGINAWNEPPAWNEPRQTVALIGNIRIWSLSKWGEDMLANPRGGAIYWWQFNDAFSNRAEQLDTASEAPTQSNYMIVFSAARHVISFGCTPFGESVLDPMLIRWSDQENFNGTDAWEPQETNLAGDLRLGEGTQILGALQTLNNEILVWTDTAIYKMTYTADDLVFGVQFLSRHSDMIGPNAATDVEGLAFFMSDSDFYIYDGRIRILPSTVRSHVFDNLNRRQLFKCFVESNRNHQEVWFFYVSKGSTEVDSYVAYNMMEDFWHIGKLSRTAWIDICAYSNHNPVAFGPDQDLFYQDVPDSAPLDHFIESGEFMADDGGDRIMYINRMIPDMERIDGNVELTVKYRQYPGQSQKSKGPFTIDTNTGKIDMRVRGRQIAIRFDAAPSPETWTLSTIRADVRPDGRR